MLAVRIPALVVWRHFLNIQPPLQGAFSEKSTLRLSERNVVELVSARLLQNLVRSA